MNHTEFQIAAAAALFVTFLMGWLAGWLVHRAGQPVGGSVAPPAPQPVPVAPAAGTVTEAALTEARAELREAHVEIEELRAYIDRKLNRDGGSGQRD